LLPAYTAEQACLPEPAVLQRNIERVRAWRLGDLLAKTVRECTLFAVEQTRRTLLRRAPRGSGSAGALAGGAGQRHRQRRGVQGRWHDDGGAHRGEGRALLIKRYNLKNLRHALGRLWRPSRAWHSWREAHRLLFFDIPTPRPLALIEERCGPLRRRAWLICEYCPGPNLLRHLSADSAPPADEGKAIREPICSFVPTSHQPWRPQGHQSALGRRARAAHRPRWRRAASLGDRACACLAARSRPPVAQLAVGCALQRWLDEQLPAAEASRCASDPLGRSLAAADQPAVLSASLNCIAYRRA
jgi:hypothetical protein